MFFLRSLLVAVIAAIPLVVGQADFQWRIDQAVSQVRSRSRGLFSRLVDDVNSLRDEVNDVFLNATQGVVEETENIQKLITEVNDLGEDYGNCSLEEKTVFDEASVEAMRKLGECKSTILVKVDDLFAQLESIQSIQQVGFDNCRPKSRPPTFREIYQGIRCIFETIRDQIQLAVEKRDRMLAKFNESKPQIEDATQSCVKSVMNELTGPVQHLTDSLANCVANTGKTSQVQRSGAGEAEVVEKLRVEGRGFCRKWCIIIVIG